MWPGRMWPHFALPVIHLSFQLFFLIVILNEQSYISSSVYLSIFNAPLRERATAMFRDRRNPALGISRTYGKDRSGFGSSQLGIAGGRPADAILRLCAKNQRRNRRIAASLSPNDTLSSEEESRDVFEFPSSDSFDNLQKSASL